MGKRITGEWPAYAVKLREEGEEIARYVDIARLRAALADPNERSPVDTATVARIWRRFPRDGAGTLRVLVQVRDPVTRECSWYAGSAGGYGYDKTTAAVADTGATVGRHPFGDHCGSFTRWDDEQGWLKFGIEVVR